MLGNRVVTVQLAKQPKTSTDDTTETTSSEIDWDKVGQIAAIAQETAETVAKVVAITYIAKRLVDTTCKIAVIVAEKKL